MEAYGLDGNNVITKYDVIAVSKVVMVSPQKEEMAFPLLNASHMGKASSK